MKKDIDEKISKMIFASVYPHYINKLEKKGRTKEESSSNRMVNWF